MKFEDFILDTAKSLEKVDDYSDYVRTRESSMESREERMMQYVTQLAFEHSPISPTQAEYGWLNESKRSDDESIMYFDSLDLASSAYNYARSIGLSDGEIIFDREFDPMMGKGRYAIRIMPHVAIDKSEELYALLNALSHSVCESDLDDYVEFSLNVLDSEPLSEATATKAKPLPKIAKSKVKSLDPKKYGFSSYLDKDPVKYVRKMVRMGIPLKTAYKYANEYFDVIRFAIKNNIDEPFNSARLKRAVKNGKLKASDVKPILGMIRRTDEIANDKKPGVLDHNPWHGRDGKFTTKAKALKSKGSWSYQGSRKMTTKENMPFADKMCGRTNRVKGLGSGKYGLRCSDGEVAPWASKLAKEFRARGRKK